MGCLALLTVYSPLDWTECRTLGKVIARFLSWLAMCVLECICLASVASLRIAAAIWVGRYACCKLNASLCLLPSAIHTKL